MAFKLNGALTKQLNSSGRLTNEKNNPSLVQNMKMPTGWKLPADFLSFDEASADAEIDKVTAMTEALSQGDRVGQAYIQLAAAQTKYDKTMKVLAAKVARMEIGKEEAMAELQSLKHQVDVARRTAGLQYANDVEQSNVGFANFQRKLKQNLYQATNTSRGGTEQGSPSLSAVRTPISIAS